MSFETLSFELYVWTLSGDVSHTFLNSWMKTQFASLSLWEWTRHFVKLCYIKVSCRVAGAWGQLLCYHSFIRSKLSERIKTRFCTADWRSSPLLFINLLEVAASHSADKQNKKKHKQWKIMEFRSVVTNISPTNLTDMEIVRGYKWTSVFSLRKTKMLPK